VASQSRDDGGSNSVGRHARVGRHHELEDPFLAEAARASMSPVERGLEGLEVRHSG
jgi:hypothetical protein